MKGDRRHGGDAPKVRARKYQPRPALARTKWGAPLVEESSAKPPALGGSGKNNNPPRMAPQGYGPVEPHGTRSAVNASARSALTPP